MQRAIGNRRVAAILQRAPDDGPLSDAQVAKAIRFYKVQPERYTPEIIRQIQARVGLEETGVADADTAQAVATFQRDEGTAHPELVVDGIAGARTLPRMFPSGLQAAGEGTKFGEEAQTEVIDRWQQLTVDQRIAELIRLVNVHLEAAGVPPVTPNPQDTLNDGAFNFPDWTMIVGREALGVAQPDLAKAKDLIDTIYHEARHAEQWFRIAQLRCLQRRRKQGAAEDERVAKAVATELGIPKRIADLAVKPPGFALGSMDALIAQGWFDSVYGTGSTRRDQILTELDRAEKALEAAKKKKAKNDTPANQAAVEKAQERVNKAIAGHATLPEEVDAFVAGESTTPGVTRGAPPPAPAPAGGAPAPGGAQPAPTGLDPLRPALEQLVGVNRT